MKKKNSMLKILNLLALNDILRKRRLNGEQNVLYENRLKKSETIPEEKDRAIIRRILVS